MAKRIKLPTRPTRYIVDPNVGIIATAPLTPREREKQEPVKREPPSAQQWLDALNNRGTPQAKSLVEIDSSTKRLLSRSGGLNPNSEIAVQSSQLPSGVGVVRAGIASQAEAIALNATAGAMVWSCTLTVFEGFRGALFESRITTYKVPPQGKTVSVKGDFVYASLSQDSTPTTIAPLMSLSIEPGDVRRMEDQRTGVSKSIPGADPFVFVPQFATHVSASIDNGVLMGDLIRIMNPNNTTSVDYPAREGGLYPLGEEGTRVEYVPAALAALAVTWTFYGWK